MGAEWRADGTELACAFVQQRTGVTGQVALRRSRRRRPPDEATWSGARADARDPVLAAAAVESVLQSRGWHPQIAVHTVTGRWDEIVGPAIAAHAQLDGFTDGVLQVRCDSTAWATQLRLLVPELLARLTEEAGPDLVRSIVVVGPAAPSWVHGSRRVRGRGPRDTYG